MNNKIKIDNQTISEVLTVNGIRFSFEDGSWGLIRASSNKPSLVVVTESPTSDKRKKEIFNFNQIYFVNINMSNIASKKKAITELLHLMSNESTLIKNYNFRHFFQRKT